MELNQNFYVKVQTHLYTWTTLTFCSTFRVVYSTSENCYKYVKNPLVCRIICLVLQLGVLLKILFEVRNFWRTLRQNSADITAYFDFVSSLVLSLSIIVPIYWSWVNRKGIENCLDQLQFNPVMNEIRWSPQKFRKGRIVLFIQKIALIVAAFSWGFTGFGAEFMDFASVYELSETKLAGYFGERTVPTGVFHEILKVYVILVEFSYSFHIHFMDVFNVAQITSAFYITKDFVKLLESREFTNSELYSLYESFKTLRSAQDKSSQVLISGFLGVSCTFYPIHLLDVMETLSYDWHWKITMSFYILEFCWMFKMGADSHIESRRIKQILCRSNRLTQYPPNVLKSILYDFETNKLGFRIGNFMSLTPGVVGALIETILTYTMLNIQSK